VIQTLSNGWKLTVDPRNVGREERWAATVRPEAQDAPVPGIIQQVVPGYHGVVWYWTRFRPVRKAAEHERYLLAFGAVDYLSQVYVNGVEIGGHEGGETPFVLDATAAIKPDAQNLLAVRVLNPMEEPIDGVKLSEIPHRNNPSGPPQPGAGMNTGGIIETVHLEIAPAVRITDIFARPDARTGRIDATVTVVNQSGSEVSAALAMIVGPAAGGEIEDATSDNVACPPGESIHELHVTIREPRLWDIDDPQLYRVTASLTAGPYRHDRTVRCGFRDFRVEDGFFRLNGRRIFLKSTHTGNHFPIGQIVPPNRDQMRRDFIMAKAAGYNMVRFIAGLAHPEQLDFCDEIGLMVYEESKAGWLLADSPHMRQRYDASTREMIVRDRNHPCVTIWGMLNETWPGRVFNHAVEALEMVRELDETRLVLLNSGRFDHQPNIGSAANPGSRRWQYLWGDEGEGKPTDTTPENYYRHMGEIHIYPPLPHPRETIDLIRGLGQVNKPIFFSEYGLASVMNVIDEIRRYQQVGARTDLEDATLIRSMAERFEADWRRWEFDSTCAFPEHLLRASQEKHFKLRRLGFDMIRSNPGICGYNLTGMLDHGFSGEGVWTYWREWKPGCADAMTDGWADLRWCLFVTPQHVTAGKPFTVEAVLANEDVLGPGTYPARFRILGDDGIVWEKSADVTIPQPPAGKDGPLAVPAIKEQVTLDVPAGQYLLAAELEHGGAPRGDRLEFPVSVEPDRSKVKRRVRVWGLDERIVRWLEERNVACQPFDGRPSKQREVILVGQSDAMHDDVKGWRRLAEATARGGCAVFLSPAAFVRILEKPRVGRFAREGHHGISNRQFEVANVSPEEHAVFAKEFYGNLVWRWSDVPEGEYTIELGFCEGYVGTPDERVFHVAINGRRVLEDFDIVKEAGGPRLAVLRTFKCTADKGQVEIKLLTGRANGPSVSRLRIYDSQGRLILEDTPATVRTDPTGWLPLANKGTCGCPHGDDLYHKETAGKHHAVFDGLQTGGMLEWDYWGPVISHLLFDGQDKPDEVMAAGFGPGKPIPTGYLSGTVLSSHRFGEGRFYLNAFRILENLGSHPVANRLLLNLIDQAAAWSTGPAAALSEGFEQTLRTIGYAKEPS